MMFVILESKDNTKTLQVIIFYDLIKIIKEKVKVKVKVKVKEKSKGLV